MPAVIVGAGPIGLATAVMLSNRGIPSVVLEKDPTPPPPDISEAWEKWNRTGVAQFRQAHILHGLGRSVLDTEAPQVITRLRAEGAYQVNPAHHPPQSITNWAPDVEDARFEIVNSRRAVLEAALARQAEASNDVDIRRGVAVESLATGSETIQGVPHVNGVVTSSGDTIQGDLVLDTMGRRSRLPEMVSSIGGRRPREVDEDSRFVYYTQFYRTGTAGIPVPLAPGLWPSGSISILVIPADKETWSVTIYASSADKAMRAVKDPEIHSKVVNAHPSLSHFTDGERVGEIDVMAGVSDRQRFMIDELGPVVTGIIPIGDSWACTNPSLGRGISMGLRHAQISADVASEFMDQPARAVSESHRRTSAELVPIHDATLRQDRQRVAEIESIVAGDIIEKKTSPSFAAIFGAAAGRDAQVFRWALGLNSVLTTEEEVFSDENVARIRELGATDIPPAESGLSREDLLGLVVG
jgi:2-polyprenyl-6-methoxyphenol hydroxylase-like FAD-dependent oxidoreductase